MAMEMVYNPVRMCGESQTDLAIPGLTTFNGTLKVCLGNNPSTYFSANGDITLAGFPLSSTDVCISANDQRGCPGPGGDGLYLSSQLTLPGLLSADINGYYQSIDSFDLSGSGAVTLAGFSLAENTVRLNPQTGLFVDGAVNIPGFVRTNFEGHIQPNGAFSLTGSQDFQLFGLNVSQTSMTLTNGGLNLRGSMDILGLGSTQLDASVFSDGRFNSNTAITLNLGILQLTGRLIMDQNGAQITSSTSLGATSIDVSGSVSGAGFSLTGSTGVNIPLNSPEVCSPATPAIPAITVYEERVCTTDCLPEVCVGGDRICAPWPFDDDCFTTPRTCTQLCGADAGLPDICVGCGCDVEITPEIPGIPGTCVPGTNLGNLGATVNATVTQGGASFTADAGGCIAGACVSGDASVKTTPPQICVDIDWPSVNILGENIGVPSTEVCLGL
jgi:hypothetical protein